MVSLFQSSGNLLADRRFGFAQDLAARGELEAAADLLAQTVALAPAFASAWYALGDLQDRLAMPAEAAQSFRQALRHDGDDRHGAGLRLACLGAADGAAAMPSAYVETLFDQYAERFDAALVEGLAYRGPAVLRAAIERASPSAPRFAAMLDLGCGTGLAGEAFRDIAARITGVDLSAGMLAVARPKGIYADLVQADLAAFLAACGATYDLVTAADVFVYVADLAPMAAAIARVLAPLGLLAFTVETHAGDGVALGDKLRYAHGEAHVRAALAVAGIDILDITPVSTRTEAGAPVPGLVVVARARPRQVR
jgi:predicted TPR repeat methyltransferase